MIVEGRSINTISFVILINTDDIILDIVDMEWRYRMEEKWKRMDESPMIFMDWPKIEVEEDNIILKSRITKVTITNLDFGI